jgi:hypothetical protein
MTIDLLAGFGTILCRVLKKPVQQGRSRRKHRRRSPCYVEDAFEARTQLGEGGFFNVLLIGVTYAASSYELEELQPGLRLTAEGA